MPNFHCSKQGALQFTNSASRINTNYVATQSAAASVALHYSGRVLNLILSWKAGETGLELHF